MVNAACLESRRSRARSPLWNLSFKETKCFFPGHTQRFNIVGNLRDREVARSTADRQGSNDGFCVWRAVSTHPSHHPQKILLAQFSLYVHIGGLKPHSFHFIYVLMLLTFLSFSRVIFLPLTKSVFYLWLLVPESGIFHSYHGNATLSLTWC